MTAALACKAVQGSGHHRSQAPLGGPYQFTFNPHRVTGILLHRFFSESPLTSNQACLVGAEAHHLLHVLRLGVGDGVILFDGEGAEFRARVEVAGRQKVELTIEQRIETDRELPFALTLGVALPKGDRQRWLVEKVTELGVSRIVPLHCERSVVQASRRPSHRLQRAVIEACKQCGRNCLTEIAPSQDFLEWAGRALPGTLRLFAHPEASQRIQELLSRELPAEVEIAIGPEGGFSPKEFAAARYAGWHPVNLGPRWLRVETAAVAAVSAVALGGV